ncbi:MAG: hypothetical protein GXC75_05385 [Xanthomonadaceae bacterium]|nr:hypothetical protein [Xanthomonadaceae bacterium]
MSHAVRKQIEDVLRRVEETLQTAQHGLDDLLGKDAARHYTGLRNLIVFGRSVTFVLQNLRGIVGIDFDAWYEPQKVAMSADPLMRYFVQSRNELEKQGKLSVGHSLHISSFSVADMARFGAPPVGAVSFFIGDSVGGTGWVVKAAEGATEKYYVELPADIGVVRRHFANLLSKDAPDLQGRTIEELSAEYVGRLRALVGRAQTHFLN